MNWTSETLFNRERFEAWVFSQPDAREWDYGNPSDCAGCCFIKETTSIKKTSMGADYVYADSYDKSVLLPHWLIDLLSSVRHIKGHYRDTFTASELKLAYAQMFPEQEISVPVPAQDLVNNKPTKATNE